MTTLPLLLAALAFSQGSDTRLVDLDSASMVGNLDITRDPFSISGRAYGHGLETQHNGSGTRVYFIPKGIRRFVSDIGFRDDAGNPDPEMPASYEIRVDGANRAGGPDTLVSPGQEPKKLDLDVSGKRSIQIHLQGGVALGEPMFSTTASIAAADNGGGEPKKAGKRPILASPADNAVVSGETVNLRWNAVEGARAYGISIVSLKTDEVDDAGPKIWSGTVRGVTTYAFSLKGLPPGQYLWSIIAFGGKEPLGAFSAERVFTVDR